MFISIYIITISCFGLPISSNNINLIRSIAIKLLIRYSILKLQHCESLSTSLFNTIIHIMDLVNFVIVILSEPFNSLDVVRLTAKLMVLLVVLTSYHRVIHHVCHLLVSSVLVHLVCFGGVSTVAAHRLRELFLLILFIL